MRPSDGWCPTISTAPLAAGQPDAAIKFGNAGLRADLAVGLERQLERLGRLLRPYRPG
jgi:hypothetical protein